MADTARVLQSLMLEPKWRQSFVVVHFVENCNRLGNYLSLNLFMPGSSPRLAAGLSGRPQVSPLAGDLCRQFEHRVINLALLEHCCIRPLGSGIVVGNSPVACKGRLSVIIAQDVVGEPDL